MTDLPGDSGAITVGGSPDYFYENNMDCEWRIEADPGTTISFSFTYFDLEGGSCGWDYVLLEDNGSLLGYVQYMHETDNGIMNKEKLISLQSVFGSVVKSKFSRIYSSRSLMCGEVLPEPITSASNHVVVRFHTDGSVVRSGFILTYEANGKISFSLSYGGLLLNKISRTLIVSHHTNRI